MRKYFLLLMGLFLSWSAAMAADIDLTTAQSVARSFMSKQVANGRLRAAAASNLKLAKAEASVVNPKAVDYYIFNAEKSYVVVAGDDLAPAILMYGEEGIIDLNDIPPAMQWLLNKYKYQIDGLKAGTHRPNFYSPKAVTAVPPMVTANWDQSAPYNNQCPTSGSRRAVTGCPATSLAMCYYKWKWPKTFPAVAAISSSASSGYSAAALSERTADWDNIIDEYTGPSNTSYNTTQANAVAWLMRYAGQAIPDYMYGYDASGANDPEIYQGVLNMGYTNAKYYMLTEFNGYSNSSQYYTDAQWNEWMLAELHAGRPIEYLAFDRSAGGHAFNVFGCDVNGKYYVNWGWSGDSNGYCTLHNFTTATGSTGQSGSFVFNYGEAMIIGIEPPASAFGPQLNVNSTSVGFTTAGQQKIITLTGSNLTSDVTVALNDPSDAFSLSVAGLNNANINAIQPKSTGSVTIPKASISESTPVNIVVTLKAGVQSNASGTVTLSSNGAENVTIALNASLQAEDTGGTASDAYLNIAKYATIDDAGWNTNYVDKMYMYTEYPNDNCAWLTLSVFGAWSGVRYTNNNGPQKWITTSVTSGAGNSATVAMGTGTWNASDIFLGSSKYFTSATSRFFGTGSTSTSSNNTARTITFQVTNTTGIKLIGMNNNVNLNNYPTRLQVYECQKNADGTLTQISNTPVTGGDLSSTTRYSAVNFSVTNLDPSKYYKVVASATRARLYEIAFQTPLAVPETPVIVSAEPTATTADITWVGGENNDSWNLRYRPYVEPEMETLTWDFNTNDQLQEWNVIDVDGDGNSWDPYNIGSEEAIDGAWLSFSYDNDSGPLTPDNWLLSPEIQFGGELSFYAWGYNANYAAEVFNVLVAPSSAVDGTSVYTGQFVSITPDITTTGTKTKYTFDLSAYEGSGYFVIQHHNVTDQFVLVVDDMSLTYPAANQTQPEWIYVNDVTSPYTIEGLTPETTYEVQVQGENDYGASDWTASTIFTTLNGVGVPTIVSATPTATTSDIVWTAGEGNDGWNMRYRPYVPMTMETILWDFPNDDAILDQQLEGWGIYDADGDGNNWELWYTDESQTDLCWGSESYLDDGTSLNPDNYLVSPDVTLGGTLKFKAKNANANYTDNLGIFLVINETEETVQLGYITPPATETEYEYDLSGYNGTGYFIFRHYNSYDKLAIFLDDIEVTYPSVQPGEWIYVNDVTSPYTIEGLTPETTYEVQVQGVNDISTSAWTASTLFTTLAIEGQDLAYIEEHGVPGTTYRVSNELVAVDYAIVGDVVYLWCKDQGNASIAPAPAVGDKIDYLRNDQYAQAGRAWDESNWVVLKFTPGSVAEKVKSITDAVGHELNAGTITGVYSDAVNYTITMPAGEGMPAGAVGLDSPYTPNVYCVANFNPANLTADGAQSNENGNVYFFMTPKVQEVCEITYAYWDATNFIVPTTSGFVGSLSLDWAYNEAGNVTSQLNADNVYRFKTVVQRTGATTSLPALKAEGGNYKVAPLNLTSDSKADIPTAIGTVKAGVDVVDVYYVNSIGVMSKTPFHGVNVVVTRYSDGSRSSVKKVFK